MTDAELSAHLPVPREPERRFYNDVPAERVDALIARLVPQSARSFSDVPTHGFGIA